MTHPGPHHPDPSRPGNDGTDGDELFANLGNAYGGLVDDLTGELDLDTGAALAAAADQHAALTRELADELDLDAGLQQILGPTAPHTGGGGPAASTGTGPDETHRPNPSPRTTHRVRRLEYSLVRAKTLGRLATLCELLETEHRYEIVYRLLTDLLNGLVSRTWQPHNVRQHAEVLTGLAESRGAQSKIMSEVLDVAFDVVQLVDAVHTEAVLSKHAHSVMVTLGKLHEGLLKEGRRRVQLRDVGGVRREVLTLWVMIEDRTGTREEALWRAADIVKHLKDMDWNMSFRLGSDASGLPDAIARLFDSSESEADTRSTTF